MGVLLSPKTYRWSIDLCEEEGKKWSRSEEHHYKGRERGEWWV